MTKRKSAIGAPVWLGQQSADGTPVRLGMETGRHEAFGGGKLWIGQHTADQDILVFDPTEEDPSADILTLYSLTQHRRRSFARATVGQRIHALTDEITHARAKKDYARRSKLRDAHEQALAAARTERRNRQRDSILATHRGYVEALGLTYRGVRETGGAQGTGRESKCHKCGMVLDDFVGAMCELCSGVLCSCGACACGKPVRRRGSH